MVQAGGMRQDAEGLEIAIDYNLIRQAVQRGISRTAGIGSKVGNAPLQGNIYCIFCGGPCTDKALGPNGKVARVKLLDKSKTFTLSDAHHLQSCVVIFAETPCIGRFDRDHGELLCLLSQDRTRMILPWDLDELDVQYKADTVDVEYPVQEPNTEEMRFSCDPGDPKSGALAHTICARLFMSMDVLSGIGEQPELLLVHADEQRRVFQARKDGEDNTDDIVQHDVLGLERGRGRVHGIVYGTEDQSNEEFTFKQENVWMLSRPDTFLHPKFFMNERVPKFRQKARRRRRPVDTLPLDTFYFFLRMIMSGLDTPMEQGRVLLALAGTSKLLRYRIMFLSDVWFELCRQAEFFSNEMDKTMSSISVRSVIVVDRADPYEYVRRPSSSGSSQLVRTPTFDWMRYFAEAAHSPNMRNRQRIMRICTEVWERLGYHRQRDRSHPTGGDPSGF
ncbi:hypothetical protein DFS34DRAFT_603233 [Phlyctochytrium arcticum]|nr:hypothetical protein DFS34DRAFT_603233 [Phlyctochytrium arcticum]